MYLQIAELSPFRRLALLSHRRGALYQHSGRGNAKANKR